MENLSGFLNKTTISSETSDVFTLLAPAAIALGILGTAYCLSASRKKPVKKEEEGKRLLPLPEYVRPRVSHLDPGGGMVKAWSLADQGSMIETSRFSGLFNLFFVVMLYYVLTNMYHSYCHSGIPVPDMKRLQGMWKSVPDLAFWSTIMYAFSFSAFFLQKAHVKGWIRSRVIMSIVQHTLQSILLGFTGIIVVLDSHDGWPFSQRIAQCGLSAVLFMKMHSYLIANRDLEEFYLGLKKDPDALFATYRAHEFKQALQERGIEPCSEDRTKLQRQFVEEIAKVKYDAVTKNSNRYPDNVTLWNFFIYSLSPILVYEPVYPRTDRIRISYLIEKVLLCFFLAISGHIIVSDHIRPVFREVPKLDPVAAATRLILPLSVGWLVIFLLVWECVTNFMAEVTYFADRQYYQDWWNSTSFSEFARKWNTMVHEFLSRHVYIELMHRFRVSRSWALVGTFMFSIFLHELILMACFKMIRPWLMLFSLFQFPVMIVMRSPIFKGKRLGNLIFWWGLITGLSLIAVLYTREYCVGVTC